MGGPGGHVPPQVLGYQLTLFGPRGEDYARHITTGPAPIFLEDAASLERLGFRHVSLKISKDMYAHITFDLNSVNLKLAFQQMVLLHL